MSFEEYVPAAIITAAIIGVWLDVRREIAGVRRDIFALNGRVSRIEGLLTPDPRTTPPESVEQPAR